MPRVIRLFSAALFFALVAGAWTYPLPRHLSTHLPGSGIGDNASFVWNAWWMRTALAAGGDPFQTSALFAPVGADLTLHTYTPLLSWAGATVLAGLPVVTAVNILVIVSVFLNGLCAYWLGWRVTRDHPAALAAGLIFGGSPFVAAHLQGHFNLTSAWVIPLFACAVLEALRHGSTGWAVTAGLVLGATVYVDAYFVVFQAALLLTLATFELRGWTLVRGGVSARRLRAARLVLTLVAVAAAAIAAIAITGGFELRVGPVRLSARTPFNVLQALWLLIALWAWLRWHPRLTAPRNPASDPADRARVVMIVIAVSLVVAAPVLWNAVGLFAGGEYVTQRYLWRSAPKGVDLATLVLGNPSSSILGATTRSVYGRLGIDAVESSAWLGLVPVLLAGWAIRRRWADPSVRRWTLSGAVFFLWALGPHLMVFGVNTGMILPQTLLRYVPVVSNARIPGRAMVVVYLALAMLAAIALAGVRRRSTRPAWFGAMAVLLIAVDFLPAPFPLAALDRPAIYDTLHDRPEQGTLLELPLGIRDGFGTRGLFDDRVLLYQTIHQRPIAGGFIARLPPSVARYYDADPLLSGLLRASGGAAAEGLPDRTQAGALLGKNGIAFVMLNRTTAPTALIDYTERVLPLALVTTAGDRTLYRVVP